MASLPRPSFSGSKLVTDTHAALPFILEHILTYPQRYHISTGQKEKSKDRRTSGLPRPSTADAATLRQAGETLKQALIEKIAMSPSQPFKLPPTYIMDFVRGVFTEDLCLVDFTQALTALDYLKEMESRRRREMTASVERLGLDVNKLDERRVTLKAEKPAIAEWISTITDKAKRIESLYTQVYIGLRRWTLINEMRLEPFNKANCIAMLNTLYPATYTSAPTAQLTTTLLNTQRNAFLRYILAVESNGKDVLQKLEQQGKRPNDANAWPIVRDIVDKYLRTANNLIQDCTSVICEEDVTSGAVFEKRTDSGVSFGSDTSRADLDTHPAHRRPSTTQAHFLDVPAQAGTGSHPKTPQHHRKRSSNGEIPFVRPDALRHKEVRKVGSTLERLARELKRMRSRSNEGRGDFSDRPRSRSRGPSDASYTSGWSGESSGSFENGDTFAMAAAPLPLPPLTASTSHFPDVVKDDMDDHILPLPGQVRARGLKKMKSAGNMSASAAASREHTISSLKQSLAKTAAQEYTGPTVQLHNSNTVERKFKIPQTARSGDFVVSEEQRRDLIARARAEKENLGPHPSERRHSPLECRVDALLNGGYGAAANVSTMNLDILDDAPIRRSSPGRNKLRDFYGVSNFEVPTNFAH